MRVASWLLILVSAAAAFAQEPRAGETITVERIIIDARVTDSKGEPLLSLGKSDFTVNVDGKNAAIQHVDWIPETAVQRELAGLDESRPLPATDETPAPAGRLLIFFFQTDFGRNAQRIGGQMKVLPYADQIIDGLEVEDRVAVFSFDSHLKFRLDFSGDREEIREAARGSLAIDEPPQPKVVPNPSLARRLDRDEMRNAKSSEESLIIIGNALKAIPGPKSLILFGWGLGKKSGNMISMGGSYLIARHLLESARVSIFSIDTTLADYHDLEMGMRKASADTGGFYAKTFTFPQIAVDRLQKTLAGHYEIEVRKPDGLRPGTHAIDVQVSKRGAIVMARSSYVDTLR